MVYLRELCQNARDAGAAVIRVRTETNARRFDLIFEDDGHGMTFDHAKRYLFTLYASSKEQESDSAGRFGVGFWSVLLSSPSSIAVSSKTASELPWCVRMDGELLTLKEEPAALTAPGTHISVSYAIENRGDADRLRNEAARALRKYCRFLTQNNRRRSPLPLWFDDTRIDEPFTLNSPCWMTFANRHIEGAVGVTETPGVEIYARGLPVWQGTVLDELKYGAKRQPALRLPRGLAPYYLVNGHDLNVTYDRRAVVDDRALAALRRTARAKMDELLRRYLDQVSPRPVGQRLFEAIRRGAVQTYHEHRLIVFLVALLLIAALTTQLLPSRSEAVLVLSAPGPNAAEPPPAPRPLGNPLVYDGPTTERTLSGTGLALIYAPGVDTAFRIAAMEHLDAARGITGSPPGSVAVHPPFVCEAGCLDVGVALEADAGWVILPVPTGHRVAPASVALSHGARPILYETEKGEPAIRVSHRTVGHITYRTGPGRTPLSPARRATLLAVSDLPAPPAELRTAIARIRAKGSTADQITAAVDFVRRRIGYDTSGAVTARYTEFTARKGAKDWVDFVFAVGRGDCDVKNTLLVYLLRSLGIPARLAVGPVGEAGRATALMHAWVEYYDGRFRTADATGTAGVQPQRPTETQPSPRRPATDAARALEAAPAPPALAPPIEERASPAGDTGGWLFPRVFDRRRVLHATLGLALLLLGLLALSTRIRSGQSGRMNTPDDPSSKQLVAARIAAGALAFPEWWNLGGGIRTRRILPTLSGRPISPTEAERLAERGALYAARRSGDWLKRARRGGAVILDGSSEVFEQIAALLPSVTDLDELEDLSPLAPEELPDRCAEQRAIARGINLALARSGLEDTELRITMAQDAPRVHEVDLAAMGHRPARLIIVPDTHPLFDAAETVPKRVAVFRAMAILVESSDRLRPHRDRLRRAAAAEIWGIDV